MSSATMTVLPDVWVTERKQLSAVQQPAGAEQMVPSGHRWSRSVSLDAAKQSPSLASAVLSSAQHVPSFVCHQGQEAQGIVGN